MFTFTVLKFAKAVAYQRFEDCRFLPRVTEFSVLHQQSRSREIQRQQLAHNDPLAHPGVTVRAFPMRLAAVEQLLRDGSVFGQSLDYLQRVIEY